MAHSHHQPTAPTLNVYQSRQSFVYNNDISRTNKQGAILRDIQGACYVCIQGCQKEFPGCGKRLTGSMQVYKEQTRPMRRDEKLFMRKTRGQKVIFGRGQQIQEKDWTKAHRPFVSPAWWPWLCGGMADGGGGAHTPTKPPQKWPPQVFVTFSPWTSLA